MKRRGILIAFLVAGALQADVYPLDTTKPRDAGPFYRIHRQSKGQLKWGFIDAQGNTAITPQFSDEGYFFGGLARVVVRGLSGFVNESGRIAIPARYQDVGDFREDLAPVRSTKEWGYIDQKGQVQIAPAFQGAASFREGLARVEVWEELRCANGSIYPKDNAPDYVYYIQSDIRHGMNNTCYPLDSKVGYIDKSGRLLIPLRYHEARDFFEGLAAVRMSPTGKYGFIDRKGVVAIDFQFDEIGEFSEGVAWARVGRSTVNGIRNPGSCGYIDHSGKFVIQAQFAEAGNFSEGLAPVSFWDRTGRGFIDRSGKVVIPARYRWVEPFSEGLAKACTEVTITSLFCFYIDRSGKTAISSLQALGPFSGGLAIAQERNERGSRTVYIDKTGRVIAPTEVEASQLPGPLRPH
jgi:hypothetical protein